MEIKKCIRNKFYIFCIITVAICFGLGYFLLASLDKIVSPTIAELYNSIYTVYTEFGMLIFPVLILSTFTSDYKNKNILFYKLMGYNWFKYFFSKVCINFICLSVPTILGIIFVSLIYQDYSYLTIMILYFESVLSFQVLLECLWGFFFKSMMLGYMVNFAYWLFSIIFATANARLSFFARYDAANNVYINLGEYFNTKDRSYLNISENFLYTLAVFIFVLCFVYLGRKRWEKNGI